VVVKHDFPPQIQEHRRDELLRRQLGPQLLTAIADPEITDIIINEDGRVWFEAHGKGLFEASFCLPEASARVLWHGGGGARQVRSERRQKETSGSQSIEVNVNGDGE
jgi:hypothetical protein